MTNEATLEVPEKTWDQEAEPTTASYYGEPLTPEQAAKYLKVSVSTLSAWRGRKYGPVYSKVGHQVRYTRWHLDNFMENTEVEGK